MAEKPLDSTVVDGASLFEATEIISERFGRRININYPALYQILQNIRLALLHWRGATLSTILLSIDPNSEGQKRFQAMIGQSDFKPDLVHYRDAFSSLPPGRSARDAETKPLVSFAARIAYIAGLIAGHPGSQLLVVSHCFELVGPLADLSRRMKKTRGKVAIAYFESLLDYRWKSAGLLDPTNGLGIEWVPLDRFGPELLGVPLAVDSTQHFSAFSILPEF